MKMKLEKLRNIEKSILEIRNRIEENNSGIWKNANKYKEPNNPDLQTRINQILENGPLIKTCLGSFLTYFWLN